ncbi:MAG: signal peptidase I [Acidobacteriota bacterium]
MAKTDLSQLVETLPEERLETNPAQAGQAAPEEGQAERHSALRENLVSIVVCSIFAFFVTTYVVHPMTVPTSSMEPTILVGDRLLVDKFTVRNAFGSGLPLAATHDIQRGDIVVFKHPTDTESLWVKRVIGLPGESIEIRSKQVYVDGAALDEPYKYHSDPSIYSGGNRDFFGPVRVPEGSFFVMGDNRDNSLDGRYWGFLRRQLLVGRPLVTFWSYEDQPNAHQITGFSESLQLYAERVFYFIPRTRWSRMGRIVE